jgi:hypothetical protein
MDALMIHASAALRVSPGARAFCDAQRAGGIEDNDPSADSSTGS